MKENKPSKIKSSIKIILTAVCAILSILFIYTMYAFRDRSGGYSLNLIIDGSKAKSNPVQLKAGFAKIKITPDIKALKEPIWLAGFATGKAATGVNDDLWATGCVIDDGYTRLGIVSLDAIGFFHDDVVKVRSEIAKTAKLDYIVICSTHNHSTPDLMGLWGPNHLKTGVNKTYKQQVITSIVEVLNYAIKGLKPVTISAYQVPLPASYTSDSRKPIVFDPDLRILHFINEKDGTTLGSIISWANHPETVWSKNTEITADFPGYLRETLEKGIEENGKILERGLGGIHLYINGAIGGLITTYPSITIIDPYTNEKFQKPTHAKAKALGRALAKKVIETIHSSPAIKTNKVAISIKARTIEMPIDNIGFLLAPLLNVIDRGHSSFMKLRTEVALIQLNDIAIACVPGEIYPEIVNGGIENPEGADYQIPPLEVPPLREIMPGKIKFVFGLANDEIGYIIPKSQWDSKPPWIYGGKSKTYGEIVSVGPETAPIIHREFQLLCK